MCMRLIYVSPSWHMYMPADLTQIAVQDTAIIQRMLIWSAPSQRPLQQVLCLILVYDLFTVCQHDI